MPPRYNRRRPARMSRRRRNTRRLTLNPIRYGYRKKAYKSVMSFKTVKQRATVGILTTAQNLTYNFSLNDTVNASEFINLYDAFKIKCAVVKFVPILTSSDVNPLGTAQSVPPIHSVIDNTTVGALSTFDDYLQYSSYKMTRGLNMHTRKVYPKFLTMVDDAGTSVVGQPKSGWLRTEGSGPDVDHLSLKVHIPAGSSNIASVYQVFITYYLQCKNVK